MLPFGPLRIIREGFKMMWYLKWLMQMSRILVAERKGRVGKGYAQEIEDTE